MLCFITQFYERNSFIYMASSLFLGGKKRFKLFAFFSFYSEKFNEITSFTIDKIFIEIYST